MAKRAPKALGWSNAAVNLGMRLLGRAAPLVGLLLRPDMIADGTISNLDRRQLQRLKTLQDNQSFVGQDRLTPLRSSSAVSGAGMVGRWFEQVFDDDFLHGHVRVTKSALRARLGGLSPVLDAVFDSPDWDRRWQPEFERVRKMHPRPKPEPAPKPKPKPKPAARPAGRPLGRPLPRPTPVRPVPPSPKPGKPSKPAPKPVTRPAVHPLGAPGVEQWPNIGPQAAWEVIRDYWPEVVIEGRAMPRPQLRVRVRHVKGQAPKRERDRKVDRKSKAFLLHSFITHAYGAGTEIEDLWDNIRRNLKHWDGSAVRQSYAAASTGGNIRMFKAWVSGELRLDLGAFIDDFVLNEIEDTLIGAISRRVTELDIQFDTGALTTNQRLNNLRRTMNGIGG